MLICNGNLFRDFGYTATTPASLAVLDGTYISPPPSDAATPELFAEISNICCLVPADSVSITITPLHWKQYWKVVNEETSSSDKTLGGSVKIVSDYLGALNRVTHLPPYHIPSRCHHLDILKNILVHCRDLSFTTYYLHIRANQDDNESFDKLDQKVQLNCICNHAAKQQIVVDGTNGTTQSRLFPLEPIGVFVWGEKMTLETGEWIRF